MATETKPGVKTSEFWTMLAGGVGSGILAVVADKPWAAAILAVAAVALPAIYIWGRAILKAEAAKETNVIPDAWEAKLNMALNVIESLSGVIRDVRADKKPADQEPAE